MTALLPSTIDTDSLTDFLPASAIEIGMRATSEGDAEEVLLAADRAERALAGFQARWLKIADETGVVRRSGARNAGAWLESITSESGRDAHVKAGIADAVRTTPCLGSGLLDGSLNAGQAKQIAATAKSTDVPSERIEAFIADVKGLSAGETTRNARQLERELADETRSHKQLLADALEQAVSSPAGDNQTASHQSPVGVGVDLMVTVTLDDLIAGLNATGSLVGTGETIPIEEIRRIACEQGIIPTVLGSNSEVLELGRRTRLATPAQKRALKATYSGCGVPGCEVPFEYCDIHHIWYWTKGGPTNLSHLVPLCNHHHHLIHDEGWTLTKHTDATINLEPS